MGSEVNDESLLLYIETRAVDFQGRLDSAKINDAEHDRLREWAEDGYIEFGRICSEDIDPVQRRGTNVTHWAHLSARAWRDAHKARRERANRNWKRRQWRTTAEKRGK